MKGQIWPFVSFPLFLQGMRTPCRAVPSGSQCSEDPACTSGNDQPSSTQAQHIWRNQAGLVITPSINLPQKTDDATSPWPIDEAINSTAAVVLPMQNLGEENKRHRSLNCSPDSCKTCGKQSTYGKKRKKKTQKTQINKTKHVFKVV